MKSLLLPVAAALVATVSIAGQPDRRFDGIWVGSETFKRDATYIEKGISPIQKRAVIAISDAGTKLGVLEGENPGRYQVAAESNGNTIVYQVIDWEKSMHGLHAHVAAGRHCKLILSADGNTLTEDGFCLYPSSRGIPEGLGIRGTFRRQTSR